jgi:predicted aspartyl protease
VPAQIGFINSSGRPAIKISLFGAYPTLKTEFEAVIDTGFSGFISMPFVQAFPLGLPLIGTTSIVLADGQTHAKFIAMCSAFLGQDARSGVVILEPSSTDVLIGMEFIGSFSKTLLVYRKYVGLIDSADIDNTIKAAMAQAQTPEEPSSQAVPSTLPQQE